MPSSVDADSWTRVRMQPFFHRPCAPRGVLKDSPHRPATAARQSPWTRGGGAPVPVPVHVPSTNKTICSRNSGRSQTEGGGGAPKPKTRAGPWECGPRAEKQHCTVCAAGRAACRLVALTGWSMSCDVPGCICDVPARQEHRDLKVRCKFNPMQAVVKDRIVVLVDDSIVRGTTAKQLIALMKQANFSLFLSLFLSPSLSLSPHTHTTTTITNAHT